MDMERKEEIIQATFMLASKNGIDNVSNVTNSDAIRDKETIIV